MDKRAATLVCCVGGRGVSGGEALSVSGKQMATGLALLGRAICLRETDGGQAIWRNPPDAR